MKDVPCAFVFCLLMHSFKLHPKAHPKSEEKLCRIRDLIVLGFETALELILEGLGDVKVIQVAVPSLTDLLFGGETRTFVWYL